MDDLIRVESHRTSRTIYLSGALTETSATAAADIIHTAPDSTNVLRVDMRAVRFMDPDAFALLAQALRQWRERAGRSVTLQFPYRAVDDQSLSSSTPRIASGEHTFP